MREEFPETLQHLTLMLFGLYGPQSRKAKQVSASDGAEDPGEDTEPAAIDPGEIRKVLKGRRLPRTKRAFRGFDSPPGRF